MKMEQRTPPGRKAALTRKRRAAGRKAVETKRRLAMARARKDGAPYLISNADLRLFHLPRTNASTRSLHEFALTYDGYVEAGSGDRCAEIANGKRWVTLHDLRASLFFEQRRFRFADGTPEDEAAVDRTMRELVEKIRAKLRRSERGTGDGKRVHRLDPEVYKRAIDFAAEKHGDQKVPGSGFPYVVHVAKVAMEVISATEADPGVDRDLAVACALLHDTVEDAEPPDRPMVVERIHEGFGSAVAQGVMALTKDEGIKDKSARMVDSLRRIRIQPREVWMVKLADRITNLEPPPAHWDLPKRQRYLQEAREILATLGEASPVMRKRFEEKLVEYEAFCRETTDGEAVA